MSEAGECTGAVLVVDDDPVARRLIRATLAPVGFEVIEAGNGNRSRRTASACSPSCATGCRTWC